MSVLRTNENEEAWNLVIKNWGLVIHCAIRDYMRSYARNSWPESTTGPQKVWVFMQRNDFLHENALCPFKCCKTWDSNVAKLSTFFYRSQKISHLDGCSELQGLIDHTRESIVWWDSTQEALDFFVQHDWRGGYSSGEVQQRFVNDCISFLKSQITGGTNGADTIPV